MKGAGYLSRSLKQIQNDRRAMLLPVKQVNNVIHDNNCSSHWIMMRSWLQRLWLEDIVKKLRLSEAQMGDALKSKGLYTTDVQADMQTGANPPQMTSAFVCQKYPSFKTYIL